MKTQSRWVFILIGDDRTGKTSFQKHLVKRLALDNRDDKLNCNLVFDVKHPNLIRKFATMSVGNRSVQERMTDTYKSSDGYFLNHFKDADICIVSTHLCVADAQLMISNCHRRRYNVCGVFFTNSIQKTEQLNADISELQWDERWTAENPITENEKQQDRQLDCAAESFVQILVERTRGW